MVTAELCGAEIGAATIPRLRPHSSGLCHAPRRSAHNSNVSADGSSIPSTHPRSNASAKARPVRPMSSGSRPQSLPPMPARRAVSSCCTPRRCPAILTTATPCAPSSRTPKSLSAARSNDLCRHLRTVIRADVFRYASFEHRIGHRLDDPKAVNATSHSDCQAFPGELVNQGHEPELSTIVGLRLEPALAESRTITRFRTGLRAFNSWPLSDQAYWGLW